MSRHLPRRKHPRLSGYDYATAGRYFITICTQNRALLFGEVADAAMRLNDAGMMVRSCWSAVGEAFPLIWLDAFVVMPNHMHAVLTILDPEVAKLEREEVTSSRLARAGANTVENSDPILPEERAVSLSTIVQRYKTLTTNAYIRGVREHGWPPFDRRLWQQSFHDRIIRNDRELDHIRDYIAANHARWYEDAENPHRWTRGTNSPS